MIDCTETLNFIVLTHFLFLKIKLKVRQAQANTIPAVARMMNITVTGTSTVTVWLTGTPSYGTPPDNRIRGGNDNYCILSKNQAPLIFRHPFAEVELLISIVTDLTAAVRSTVHVHSYSNTPVNRLTAERNNIFVPNF